MVRKKLIGIFFIIQFFSCSPGQKQAKTPAAPGNLLVGKVLPDWQEGYLDIHAINTGRGEATFVIFPDGTTMLLDAAGSSISPAAEIPPPPQKPNSSVSPGQVVTNYARHFMK